MGFHYVTQAPIIFIKENTVQDDRRRRRSGHVKAATKFYLDHVLERHGVSAAVLVDGNGQVVAGSEAVVWGKSTLMANIDEAYGRKLAAAAPHAAQDADNGESGSWKGRGDEPMWSVPLSLNGTQYFFAAVSYDGLAAHDAAADTQDGVSRIFSELSQS